LNGLGLKALLIIKITEGVIANGDSQEGRECISVEKKDDQREGVDCTG
jgi:hypothetical protein